VSRLSVTLSPSSPATADEWRGAAAQPVRSKAGRRDWGPTTVLNGDVVGEVSKLKQTIGGDILVYASFQLVQTLLEHDLVDELRVTVPRRGSILAGDMLLRAPAVPLCTRSRWGQAPQQRSRQALPGPVAQLVSASPCHGEGRGFKSRRGRSLRHGLHVLIISTYRTFVLAM
jgi:hypothetical protein